MKVAFKNTIFWCWIWALIHANHFYNLELIEFKAYIAPTCISIPLSNLGWFFKKKSITYDLEQNCWDRIENLFFREKTSLPPSQINVARKVLGFLQQNLAKLNIDIGGKVREFGSWKIESFLEFTGFSTFVSTSFVQGCS